MAARGSRGGSDSGQRMVHSGMAALSEIIAGEIDGKKMVELDLAFSFTRSGNSEIAFQWLMMSIRNGYEPAFDRIEIFLTSIGRRKFIKPLYEELAKTLEGERLR